jgi:hypothetical protein
MRHVQIHPVSFINAAGKIAPTHYLLLAVVNYYENAREDSASTEVGRAGCDWTSCGGESNPWLRDWLAGSCAHRKMYVIRFMH